MIEGLIAVLGAGLLSVIGWAFTLHSRVAVLEADRGSLEKLLRYQFLEINRRLDKIEVTLEDLRSKE